MFKYMLVAEKDKVLETQTGTQVCIEAGCLLGSIVVSNPISVGEDIRAKAPAVLAWITGTVKRAKHDLMTYELDGNGGRITTTILTVDVRSVESITS